MSMSFYSSSGLEKESDVKYSQEEVSDTRKELEVCDELFQDSVNPKTGLITSSKTTEYISHRILPGEQEQISNDLKAISNGLSKSVRHERLFLRVQEIEYVSIHRITSSVIEKKQNGLQKSKFAQEPRIHIPILKKYGKNRNATANKIVPKKTARFRSPTEERL